MFSEAHIYQGEGHTYIKGKQLSAFKDEVDNVQHDNEKVVIQVDFTEDFTNQIQNAIQSSYWVLKQFTIFTACVCVYILSP